MSTSLPTDQAMKIAEELLGGVRWVREGVGYCLCPGAHLHASGKSQKKDCRVTVVPGRSSDAPTVYCFHSHCAEVIEQTNFKLRSEIGKAKARLEHAAKDLNRGAARPSGPKAQKSGASGKRVGGERAPGQSGAESRTVRTPFLQSIPAEAAPIDAGRTLRTDFLHKFRICAQAPAHDSEPATAQNASEVSEPEKPPEPPQGDKGKQSQTSDPAPDASGLDGLGEITWRQAKLERGHTWRTKLTRWVGSDGAVHHAHIKEVDGVRLIQIGKQFDQVGHHE
jgi:hypothetical protein